jgi:hypothetical protein
MQRGAIARFHHSVMEIEFAYRLQSAERQMAP